MWGVIVWNYKFTEFLKTSVEEEGIRDFAEILNAAIKNNLKITGLKFDRGIYTDLGTFDELKKLYEKYSSK